MKKLFLIILFFAELVAAQTDWVKWEAQEISYELKTNLQTEEINKNFTAKVFSGLQKAYKFLVSDLDGDNCPFFPSCSEFFVHSVNEAGLIKASFMFTDRFIRDLNFFKGFDDYPLHISGKYYDPACNYTLISQKIKFYSGGDIVNE